MEILRKEMALQEQVLDVKIIKEAFDKRESVMSLKWTYNINPNYEFIGAETGDLV